MIRRPPRSTQSRSSAASDVYKRQSKDSGEIMPEKRVNIDKSLRKKGFRKTNQGSHFYYILIVDGKLTNITVSYTHLRAHETPEHLVCRLLLEKKKKQKKHTQITINNTNNT